MSVSGFQRMDNGGDGLVVSNFEALASSSCGLSIVSQSLLIIVLDCDIPQSLVRESHTPASFYMWMPALIWPL
jgi:hypothetical protein